MKSVIDLPPGPNWVVRLDDFCGELDLARPLGGPLWWNSLLWTGLGSCLAMGNRYGFAGWWTLVDNPIKGSEMTWVEPHFKKPPIL